MPNLGGDSPHVGDPTIPELDRHVLIFIKNLLAQVDAGFRLSVRGFDLRKIHPQLYFFHRGCVRRLGSVSGWLSAFDFLIWFPVPIPVTGGFAFPKRFKGFKDRDEAAEANLGVPVGGHVSSFRLAGRLSGEQHSAGR